MGGIARLTGKMGLTGEEVVFCLLLQHGIMDLLKMVGGRWQSISKSLRNMEYDSSMVGGGSRVS